jgi:hypothetical protein
VVADDRFLVGVGRVSAYLDRLAHSAYFDSWRTEELNEALAAIDDALVERPGALNLRFQIYRQRLQRELDHRAATSDR